MATGRWNPSAPYSDSVRDQPATPNASATATATKAAPAPGHRRPPRERYQLVPAHTRSAGPTVSRARASTSDIPVNPARDSRNSPSSAPFSSSAARPSSAVDDQLGPPSRKRCCSAADNLPAKHSRQDHDQSSPPPTEHPAPGPAQYVSHEEATYYTNLEQTNKGRPTRGSRACTVCRRLKMRCVGAEDGPPCKRCRAGKHECIFEESMRGKKGTKRTDQLAKNLQSVEEKLDAMMFEMKNHASKPFASQPNNSLPILPSGDSSQGPKPPGIYDQSQLANPPRASCSAGSLEPGTAGTQRPTDFQTSHHDPTFQTASEPGQAQSPIRFAALSDFSRPSSPRLHSLPDNTLNPLGLLAEASLRNRHDRQRSDLSSSGSRRRNSSARGTAPIDANTSFSPDTQRNLTSGRSEQHIHQNSPTPSPSPSGSIPDNRDLSHPPSDPHHHDIHAHDSQTHERMVGVANVSYFSSGPASFLPLRRFVIEQPMPPSLLTDEILSNEEVAELFEIFFEQCNPHCCILEPKLHTPSNVGSRSPFLFTTICAVSSRYYEKRKELHLKCLQAAKRIAFDVMEKGYKSVEVVQAFLLLSLWNQPAEPFEEDRTWAFSGIAIRMAIDLNLHRKMTLQLAPGGPPRASTSSGGPELDETAVQQQEMCEREILNRERTWLYCFIIDRSLSAQMGKPYSIREDFIIRSSKNWHKSRYSVAEDSGITAMVDLHRIHSRILDTLYSDTCSNLGLNVNLDYSLLTKTFSQSLDQWMTECTLRIESSQHDIRGGYRQSMEEFYYNYYRLFTMSFILQHTLESPDNEIELPQVYLTCYDAATRVITIARDRLGPLGALRYAPDNQFVYIAYAAVFLLKLIRPQFQLFCDGPAVKNLVHECTVLLDEVSVDETHTPALYAAFLKVLLHSKEDGSQSRTQAHRGNKPSRVYEPGRATGAEGRQKQRAQALANQARWQKRSADEGRGAVELLYSLRPRGAKDVAPSFNQPIKQRTHEGSDVEASGSGEDYSVGPQHTDKEYGVNSLLTDGGFWDSMLMPGYSGPLDALSGGAGLVSQFERNNAQDSAGLSSNSPRGSGRVTPNA